MPLGDADLGRSEDVEAPAELRRRDASVRALVRHDGDAAVVRRLAGPGVEVTRVDYDSLTQLAEACAGATCVVSALAGLRDVVVDVQTMLLSAAVAVGVPRFVPSDYCIDFTDLPPGRNRNLDLRRESARAWMERRSRRRRSSAACSPTC